MLPRDCIAWQQAFKKTVQDKFCLASRYNGVECTFTNTSTSRPVIISDGGTANEKTAYPTQANVETTTTFVPKTTEPNDVTFKTSSSSGLSVTKITLYGISSAVHTIRLDDNLSLRIENRTLTCAGLVDIITVNGLLICAKTRHAILQKGIYIIRYKNNYRKIIVN